MTSTIRVEERHLAQAAPDIRSRAGEDIGRMRAFGGYLKRYTARRDMFISVFDMLVEPGAMSEAKSGPCMNAVVLLEAVGESRFTRIGERTCDLPLPYAPMMTYVFYSPYPVRGQYTTTVAGRFRGMEVRVGLDVLNRLGGLSVFEQAGSQPHPLVVGRFGETWVGAFPTPAALHDATRRIFERESGDIDDLAIEARGLDLLTTAIAAVREPLFCQGARKIRNGRQLEKARALLLADLAKSWTVREVARSVGLTEKRLKVDFRAHFGVPVYGYLQQARLEHAKSMLESGSTTVTEAATAVGYANPSHFAKLFRRRFGINPSLVMR